MSSVHIGPLYLPLGISDAVQGLPEVGTEVDGAVLTQEKSLPQFYRMTCLAVMHKQ